MLYVVGNAAAPITSDGRFVAAFEGAGIGVTLVDDEDAVAADADGKDLVFVSSSINPNRLGDVFATVPVPVILAESDLYPGMGMTGDVAGTDFGSTSNITEIEITGSHPLTADATGVTRMNVGARKMDWGVPAPSAVIAATLVDDPTRAAIFAYDTGDAMVVGTAPARRVGLTVDRAWGGNLENSWTAEAQQLTFAAIDWALGLPAAPRVRIMAMGDSITEGFAGSKSYRVPLSTRLHDEGCAFNYVGFRFRTHGVVDFDGDNNALSGLRTDELEAVLPGWLVGNRPDYVLLFIGTNDITQGRSIVDAEQDVRDIIGVIRAGAPEATILLAQIIPNDPENDGTVVTYNAQIAQIAADLDTAQSPIVLVDQFSTYDRPTMSLGDDTHPNDFGDAHLADVWADALLPLLGPSVCSELSAGPVPVGGRRARVLLAILIAAAGCAMTAMTTLVRSRSDRRIV